MADWFEMFHLLAISLPRGETGRNMSEIIQRELRIGMVTSPQR